MLEKNKLLVEKTETKENPKTAKSKASVYYLKVDALYGFVSVTSS